MRFLYKVKTGKNMTWKRVRRREERNLGREGEQHNSRRKWRGLILTIGLNQQDQRIS
jgi:hypothetical protein